jgi:DNA-directed RNA polymerase subunit L
MQVKNIKIEEISLKKKLKLAKYKEIIKDVSTMLALENNDDEDPFDLLPDSRYKVTFELTKITAEFANMIRVVLLENVDIYSVNYDESYTNDKMILSDYLKQTIYLMPINQELNLEDNKKWNISLNVENKTLDVLTVYSHDIKVTYNKKPVLNLFDRNIFLTYLRPDCFLRIDAFSFIKDSAYNDSGKFAFLENISYKILDYIDGKSTLIQDPRHFKIGYTTYGNIKPKKVMQMCCNTIIDKLQFILDDFKNIRYEKDKQYEYFYIQNNYRTLANVIARTIFELDNNIPYICASIIHPSDNTSIVKIKHNESEKIFKDAIMEIIKTTKGLLKKFK